MKDLLSASTREEPTACILCSENCGLRVTLRRRELARIRGDERHPSSKGYLCQKAARLNHYQNHRDRLSSPLRRRPDGSFEKVAWDVAIEEIASRLKALSVRHGPHAFAYYGGGGQGNHLGGVYAAGLRAALGTRYYYNSLAQEKTGDFWVNGRLFGRQTCHVTDDLEATDCAVFIGTNPWQAHGIPRARKTLTSIANDPERTMIVVDPRRTETARLADIHLQLRPSTDAFVLSAMLAVIVQEGLADTEFLRAKTRGYETLLAYFESIRIGEFAQRSGVDADLLVDAARRVATAKSASIRADLGLQQSLNSTLNSYLEKLLFLLTGNFARRGGNNLHSFLLPLIGHSDEEGADVWRTRATDFPEISKFFPPNLLPAEIESTRSDRLRALIVDSANPLRSAADTQAYRRAFRELELLVVIDVAFTETAALAHYVLPASSQFEKWEATFFNLGFPENTFQLRKPLFSETAGTLPEPEIYRRLLVALNVIPKDFPLLARLARLDRRWPKLRLFAAALSLLLKQRRHLQPYAANILYDTLGRALPDGAQSAAVLWFAAHRYVKRHGAAVRRTGLEGSDVEVAEKLFERILRERSGIVMSRHHYEDVWSMLRHPDGRVHLEIPELLVELKGLSKKTLPEEEGYPLVLIAGERRSYNANTILRDPGWRKTDREGALRIHPDDADVLGLRERQNVRCESRRGAVNATVEIDDSCLPGVVTLPHGYGLEYPSKSGERSISGPAINDLTEAAWSDPISATPFHKYVLVRLIPK